MEIILKLGFLLIGMSGAIACAYKAGYDNGYDDRVTDEVSAHLRARSEGDGARIDSNIRSN